MSTPEHVAMIEATVARQRAFFQTGATRPVAVRVAALHKLKREMQARETILLDALYADLHKSHAEGYMCELGLNLDELGYLARKLPQWAKPQRHPTPLAQFCSSSYQLAEPYGVVLVMSPWNYPYLLSLDPLFGAIAAGNCVVLKPSAYAPNTSRAMAELIAAVFPPDWVTVIQGGREQNAALLEQKFDYIFFTGSVDVGKMVMEKASRHLTPVTLELGGRSPVILAPDADVELAAARIAWGKFLNAGQTCVAPDHVWVPEGMAEPFVAALARQITRFYGANPLAGEELPRIVNRRHFDRLAGLLSGGRIAVGGQTDPEGLRIAPTVLVDVPEGSPVLEEEIFGPILPVLLYRSLPELVEAQRQKPRPLALYLFTRSRSVERAVLEALPFGGGCVNDTVVHLADPRLPFGGVGNSGMGACHGKAGFDAFTHEKSVLKKGRLDIPVRYPPYGKKHLGILKKLM